jgi:hypothetical protein
LREYEENEIGMIQSFAERETWLGVDVFFSFRQLSFLLDNVALSGYKSMNKK